MDTLGTAVIDGLCIALGIDRAARGAITRLSEQTGIPYRTLHAWHRDGKSPSAAHAAELGDRHGLILLRVPGCSWLVMKEAPEGATDTVPSAREAVAAAEALGSWPGGSDTPSGQRAP